MNCRFLLALPLCAIVAGCQTNYTYAPIVPNPRQIEMAEAQCQMMSGSAERGMVAWGNPNYVAGAQIGNAIGNAIRVDQFMQQCMTLQGWRRVSKPEGQPTPSSKTSTAGLSMEQREKAVDAIAIGYVVDECKVSIKADKRQALKQLTATAGAEVVAQGRARGAATLNDNVKKVGRAEVCKRAAGMAKDMGWS